jgi:hypothetical protein
MSPGGNRIPPTSVYMRRSPYRGTSDRMNKPKNKPGRRRCVPDPLYSQAVPDDDRRVDTPTSEPGHSLPRGEVCVPAMETMVPMEEPVMGKFVGFARFVAESLRLASPRSAPKPRPLSVDEIMAGPSPMSADAQKRADELRGRPRRDLPVKPLTVHRD